MDRFEQLNSLLEFARQQLDEVTDGYPRDPNVEIPVALFIKLKNYFENIRSLLDYIAFDICQLVLNLDEQHRGYFPICCKDAQSFRRFVAKNFPRLKHKAPAIYHELEQVQPYRNKEFQPLLQLSRLVNQNKHCKLTQQETRVTKYKFSRFKIIRHCDLGVELDAKTEGCDGFIIADETGTSDDFSSSDLVRSNIGKIITLDPNAMQYTSFAFTESGEDVIALLLNCHRTIEKIISRFKRIFYEPYEAPVT